MNYIFGAIGCIAAATTGWMLVDLYRADRTSGILASLITALIATCVLTLIKH